MRKILVAGAVALSVAACSTYPQDVRPAGTYQPSGYYPNGPYPATGYGYPATGGYAYEQPRSNGSGALVGGLLGAGAGALVGNQFGKGNGKTAATVGGALVGGAGGAALGDRY
jgi:hypothetical protein